MPRLGECGVPIETIVVHVGISIAAMRVHLQIGVDGEVPRQFVVGVDAVGEVVDVGG